MRPAARVVPDRPPFFSVEAGDGLAWFVAPSPAEGAGRMLWARKMTREASGAAGAAVARIEEQADTLAAEFSGLGPEDLGRAQEVVAALESLDDDRIRAQMAVTAATQAVIGEVVGKAWHHPGLLLEALDGPSGGVPPTYQAARVGPVVLTPQMVRGAAVYEELSAVYSTEDIARMYEAILEKCGRSRLLRAPGVRASLDFFGLRRVTPNSP